MAHGASTTTQGRQQHYAVPQPMAWPIMGSASLFLMALGGVFVMNGSTGGWVSIAAGFMLLLYMMVREASTWVFFGSPLLSTSEPTPSAAQIWL